MKNLTKQQWAYLAGILDGEGHICINKCKPMRGARSTNYHVEITIVNTSKELIDYLVYNFGGNVQKRKRRKENHKQIYAWKLSRKKAEYMLTHCYEFLIIKRKEADVAFKLFERMGKQNTQKLSAKELKMRDWLFDEIKRIRHRIPTLIPVV